MHGLTGLFRQRHDFAEEILFVFREQLAFGKIFIAGVRAPQEMYGHDHEIFLARMR